MDVLRSRIIGVSHLVLRSNLARLSACMLFFVAGFNIYIGLYDTTLNQLNTLHHNLNWVLAALSVIAGILLVVKATSKPLVVLAGLVWPLIYLSSLVADVETKMCLGTNSNCYATVTGAYDYLVLGSRVEGWVLWPYTIRAVIILLLFVVMLTAIDLSLKRFGRQL